VVAVTVVVTMVVVVVVVVVVMVVVVVVVLEMMVFEVGAGGVLCSREATRSLCQQHVPQYARDRKRCAGRRRALS
jgi:hypothetical protein